MKLTSGQTHFLKALCEGKGTLFHRRVIEPIEGPPYGKMGGLVRWTGGMRLTGCNILAASNFALTEEGSAFLGLSHKTADRAPEPLLNPHERAP